MIGSKIANVPQDVPVEKARSNATIKKRVGIIFEEILYFPTTNVTKPPAFKYSVPQMPLEFLWSHHVSRQI